MPSDDGITALSQAAYTSECPASLEAVHKLLDLGADPYIADEDGYPPIYWAAKKGNTKVVSLLLEKSKNIEEDQKMILAGQKACDSDEGYSSGSN